MSFPVFLLCFFAGRTTRLASTPGSHPFEPGRSFWETLVQAGEVG